MTDGSAVLMTMFHSAYEMGLNSLERGTNRLDTGAHYYDCYETSDGKYISIGSIEPQFYAQLMKVAGLPQEKFGEQLDKSQWPELKQYLEQVFRQKTRAQWCELMEGTDICFAPVLDIKEAPSHPHNQARKTYVDVDGMQQPAPAPRFSRTKPGILFAARQYGADTAEVLGELGFNPEQLETMRSDKVCG